MRKGGLERPYLNIAPKYQKKTLNIQMIRPLSRKSSNTLIVTHKTTDKEVS